MNKMENSCENKQDQQSATLDTKQRLRQQQQLQGAVSREYSTSEKENIASDGKKQKKANMRGDMQSSGQSGTRSEGNLKESVGTNTLYDLLATTVCDSLPVKAKPQFRRSVWKKKPDDDPPLEEPEILSHLAEVFEGIKHNKPIAAILKECNLQKPAPKSRSSTMPIDSQPFPDRVMQPVQLNVRKSTATFFNSASSYRDPQVVKSPSIPTLAENRPDNNTGQSSPDSDDTEASSMNIVNKLKETLKGLDKTITNIQGRIAVDCEVVSTQRANLDDPVQADGTYLLNRQQHDAMEEAMNDIVDDDGSESLSEDTLRLMEKAMEPLTKSSNLDDPVQADGTNLLNRQQPDVVVKYLSEDTLRLIEKAMEPLTKSSNLDDPVQADGTKLLNRQQQDVMKESMNDIVDHDGSASLSEDTLRLMEKAMEPLTKSSNLDGPVQADGIKLLNRQQQNVMEEAMNDIVDDDGSESLSEDTLRIIEKAMEPLTKSSNLDDPVPADGTNLLNRQQPDVVVKYLSEDTLRFLEQVLEPYTKSFN